MVSDEDYFVLARAMLLGQVDVMVELASLRLAIERHGISLEELRECRKEIERRKPPDELRRKIQALGKEDLLNSLRSPSSTVQ